MMPKQRQRWKQKSDGGGDGRMGSDKRICYRRSDPCLFLSSPLFCPNSGWCCSDDLELRDSGRMAKSGFAGFRVKSVPGVGRVAVEFLPPRVRVWMVSPTRGGLTGGVRMLGNRPRSAPLPTLIHYL
ncbi:unnamed protein product [Linum trigynum]|uniref:Uncharacterized protein n=1 Tax=Linum trigynum TaxID=586398 RepID=A0AAV2GI79_9ROSI